MVQVTFGISTSGTFGTAPLAPSAPPAPSARQFGDSIDTFVVQLSFQRSKTLAISP
jgi:hypothetical protein